MALKALCIGINNYPGTNADLAGCVNDANDWRDFLSQRGFEITQLLDSRATNRAIQRHIRTLIQGARAGDVIVVTYSGHGSWIPDQEGEEPDRREEVLCPYDVRRNGPISDAELYAIYSSLQEGVHAVFISDSCHSGTLRRVPKPSSGQRIRYLPPVIFLDEQEQERAEVGENIRTTSKSRKQGVLLMSAAQDYEFSYDTQFDGRPNGAFTYFALQTLRDLPRGASYEEWLQRIHEFLPDARWPQEPGLDGVPRQSALSVFDGRSTRNGLTVQDLWKRPDLLRALSQGRYALWWQ